MRAIVFGILLLAISNTMLAQHCPFDGTHLIAIKVVDKQGKMIADFVTPFYLEEVDNPMADSCTSFAGLIKKHFLNSNAFIAEINSRFDRNGYNTDLYNRLKNADIYTKANRMLTINQAEKTCLLTEKSETVYPNYIYHRRKFEIVYMLNGTEMRKPVSDQFIYSLCTSANEVEKFKPLIIKL